MHNCKQFITRSTFVTAVLAAAAGAWAQPVGVAVIDLGDRSAIATASLSSNVTLTNTARVVWFKIRLPRITNPHRYFDVSTSGAGFGDSEIGFYSSTGVLIATDDDDGANNFSALSFGLTNPSSPGRVPPIAASGQSPGEPNNGRDGTLSGNPNVGLLGTASDYYIAVTRFDAAFGNNFSVTPPSGSASDFPVLLTVRMDTPGGQVAPTVDGTDVQTRVGIELFDVLAFASANTTGVRVDLSSIGGPNNQALTPSFDIGEWDSTVVLFTPLSQIGVFPMTFRASNAIGDVTIDVANATVRPLGTRCQGANESPIATTPGTTIYTYTTTLGIIDGPWTTACFVSTPTGNDVWFRFQPTQSGTLTLSTCNSDTGVVGGQPDTLLGFRGRCDDAGFSTCGDDVGGCGIGTRLNNIPVTAGFEYNIAVRSWSGDIVNGRLAVTFVTGCDDIDFNNNGVFPEDQDVVDFFDVLAGGNPPTCDSIQGCNDIDFNNNGVFPEDQDVVDFFNILAGGSCG